MHARTRSAYLDLLRRYSDGFRNHLYYTELVIRLLTHRIDSPVNEVNASMIAKERGITFGEKHRKIRKDILI